MSAIRKEVVDGMSPREFLGGRVQLWCGDCLDVLDRLPENSIDSCVVDPPYHLTSIVKRFGQDGSAPAKFGSDGAYARQSRGFMSKVWDGGDIAFQPATWAKVLRVLKPGAYIVAFSSTRGFGRMSCAIEDGGFISHPLIGSLISCDPMIANFMRSLSPEQAGAFARLIDESDAGGMLGWIFGSGFPKATRIKAPGYDGFRYGGQALKPAIEPIFMGQKPFSEANGTANILLHGTGALNIDGCRVDGKPAPWGNMTEGNGGYRLHKRTRQGEASADRRYTDEGSTNFAATPGPRGGDAKGRWPANLIHDGSDDVLAAFPETASGDHSGNYTRHTSKTANTYGERAAIPETRAGDSGSAARFFYSSKADAEDRIGSKHPTVKPLDLIQYLCRLVTPPGGTVLDPFAGTGTTGEAAWREGFKAILIEREAEYQADIARRMDLAVKPAKRAAVAKTKNKLMGAEGTPLFGGEAA